MAKTKSFSKVRMSVELSYVTPGAVKEGGNSCDWNNPKEVEIVKAAHLDDNSKKILHSTLRANFSIEVNTKNKTHLEINNEVERLSNDKQIIEVINLSKELINLILVNTRPVFPQLKQEVPKEIDVDWKDRLKFDKKSMLYRTNIFNWTENPELEIDILNILQKFVDKELDSFVSLTMHYNCWGYYFNKKAYHESSLQELINHRRAQILL